MKTEFCIAYLTAASRSEALKIGSALVEERLAACVNVLGPVASVYRWDGKIARGSEVAFLAKTRRSLQRKLTARVRELHSYECPCVVFLPIRGGNPAFLRWLAHETA